MDNRYFSGFIRGMVTVSIGNFAQISFNLVGVMIAARCISKTEIGIFIMIQLFSYVIGIVRGLILNDMSVTKFIAEAPFVRKERIAAEIMGFHMLVSGAIGLLFFASIFLLRVLHFQNSVTPYIMAIFLFFLLDTCQVLLLKIIQGYQLFKPLAVVQIVNGMTKTLLTILFVALLQWRIDGLICATVLSYLLSVFFSCRSLPVRIRPTITFHHINRLINFGLPLGVNGIMSFLFTKADRLMLSIMAGPASLAIYDLAARIPDGSRALYNSFQTVYFPQITDLQAQTRYEDVGKFIAGCIRLVSFSVLLGCLFIILYNEVIISGLFSNEYAQAAPVLAGLMVSVGFALISNTLGVALVALGFSDKPMKINIVDTILNISCNFFMIPIWGIMGSVYAALIARILTNPINFYYLNKLGPKLNLVNYLKPIIIFCMCILLNFTFCFNAIQKALVIGLYVYLSVIFRIIGKNDVVKVYRGLIK